MLKDYIKNNIKRLLCSHGKQYKVVVETTPPIVIYRCAECNTIAADSLYKEQWSKFIKGDSK